MKQFVLWAWLMPPDEQKIWRDAGFRIMPQLLGVAHESAEPDVIWIGEALVQSDWSAGINVYPKLFVVYGKGCEQLPEHWQAYERQQVFVNGISCLIGSKLEEPLSTALMEYFAQQKTVDLAAVVYMTLLESVFRETAEWCGHMSSVVGRM